MNLADEREFMYLESDLKHDLKETSNNYNSRLNLDSMNDQIELDIHSNNIVKTVKWNMNDMNYKFSKNQNLHCMIYIPK